MKTVFAAALCASLVAASAALAQPVTADIAPKVVSDDRIANTPVAYPGGVQAHKDLVYSTVNGFRPVTLDLYTPRAGGGAKPLVIYIHGGGWTGGTSRNAAAYNDFPAVMANLASRGYVVASLNYRLAGEAPFPAATDDVDAAIRWLKAHAAQYGIDKTRVAVWGGSAGGHLAALAATDCSPAQAGAESDCVQAAAIWYGIFDFGTLPMPSGPTPQGPGVFLGCAGAACKEVGAKASPVTYIDAKDPPFLLIHGTADKTVPVAQSRGMLERLKAAGVKADYIELPDIDHSWIGRTPEETRAAHLKALQATFNFFAATVGKK
jgi:acetyl esterase/lipase